MEPQNLNVLVAFGAGLLSFISPCVLPLVPVYLGYLGGAAVSGAEVSRGQTFSHALFFVTGFSLVFVALGASVGLIGYVLLAYMPIIIKIGGVLLIVLGLHLAGVLKLPFLYREKRLDLDIKGKNGYWVSFLVGMIFAAGWTPCVGPILSGILLLASASQTVGRGALLLLAYSIGLGAPFLLTALALGFATKLLKKLNRYMRVVSIIAGIFLILMGVLLITGLFNYLNALLNSLTTPM